MKWHAFVNLHIEIGGVAEKICSFIIEKGVTHLFQHIRCGGKVSKVYSKGATLVQCTSSYLDFFQRSIGTGGTPL